MNMQQTPRSAKSGVKGMFKSRFGEEGVVLEADYSAIEVVVQACFSGDANLTKSILEGTDMHSFRAAAYHGWEYEDFLKAVKDPAHPEHKWANDARQDIKAPSFALTVAQVKSIENGGHPTA